MTPTLILILIIIRIQILILILILILMLTLTLTLPLTLTLTLTRALACEDAFHPQVWYSVAYAGEQGIASARSSSGSPDKHNGVPGVTCDEG